MVHVFRLLVAYDRSQVRPKITPHVFFCSLQQHLFHTTHKHEAVIHTLAHLLSAILCVLSLVNHAK